MEEQRKHDKNYPYKDSKKSYIKTFLGLLIAAVIGLVLIFFSFKYLIFPLAIKFIYWLVPNFWSGIGYFFMIWFVYKLFSFFWSPIYALLGKWSYVILGSTIIYIILQIVL